jgi:hypothetical protein
MVSVLCKRISLIFLGAFLMICNVFTVYSFSVSHQFCLYTNASPDSQQVWIKQATLQLQGISFSNADAKVFDPITTAFDGFYQIEYRIRDIGFIKFDNENWICFISHSSHNNEAIGDVTLARDSFGRFYVNYGHICGGVISFKTNVFTKSLTSKVFFENFVSDSDGKSWICIDEI